MLIIGCDFHTRYQQIAMAEDTTGELLLELRLDHERGESKDLSNLSKNPSPFHHTFC